MNKIANHEMNAMSSPTYASTVEMMRCGIANTHWNSGRHRPIESAGSMSSQPG